MNKLKLDEIYEKIFNKLYSEFNFVEKDKKTFLSLIYINYIPQDLTELNTIEKYILNESKVKIYKILKEKLVNNEFNNLFELYLENKNKIDLNILVKFNSYLKKTNYNLSFEEFSFIIEKLNYFLKPLVENNIEEIKKENYAFVKNNSFLISLVDVYCAVNNLINEETLDKSNNNFSEEQDGEKNLFILKI